MGGFVIFMAVLGGGGVGAQSVPDPYRPRQTGASDTRLRITDSTESRLRVTHASDTRLRKTDQPA